MGTLKPQSNGPLYSNTVIGCYIWYIKEGPGQAGAPPSRLHAVPNVTAHPSMASVPITVLIYDGPLLCGFNVAIKGLIATSLIFMCKSKWRSY